MRYSIKLHEHLTELNKRNTYVLWAETDYSCRGVFQGTREQCLEELKKRKEGK